MIDEDYDIEWYSWKFFPMKEEVMTAEEAKKRRDPSLQPAEDAGVFQGEGRSNTRQRYSMVDR